ncbi:hypothetical protein H2P46_16740 [Mixta sp. Marseille-Q2057]|nr:hypothetical protein [Mixta mediterraneensis]
MSGDNENARMQAINHRSKSSARSTPRKGCFADQEEKDEKLSYGLAVIAFRVQIANQKRIYLIHKRKTGGEVIITGQSLTAIIEGYLPAMLSSKHPAVRV